MNRISLTSELESVVADIVEVSGYLWQKGWAEHSGGNMSIDVTGLVPKSGGEFNRFAEKRVKHYPGLAEQCFFVTLTGSRFRDIARRPEKNLLLIRIAPELNGYQLLWGGEGPEKIPTSEFISHLKIHNFMRKNNLPQNVFLHTHPTHLIALSNIEEYSKEENANNLLYRMHPELTVFLPEGIGLAHYCRPGSEALADATVASLQNHRVVLWEKHGCTAIGSNILEAFDLIDIVNKAAEIFFICKSAGFQPQGLNNDQRAQLTTDVP